MITIRQAVYDDIPRIMEFIDIHWKKGHIMGNNRTLFDWQHVEQQQVYYIVAEDTEETKLYGTMGYIPMNHEEYPFVSTVMIRSLLHKECDMLGEAMSRYFENHIKCCNVISVGVKKRYAMVIDGIEAGHIGKLKHYYRLREQEQYRVATIQEKHILPVTGKSTLEALDSFDAFQKTVSEESLKKQKPYRDKEFIKHRYFDHPCYQYMFFHITGSKETESVLVARQVQVEGVKVLRIVDYFGKDEDLRGIGQALDKLLEDNQYEYIDFYCYGIADDIMREAGFTLKADNDENIIPNYFSPFEQKNIEIYFYTWFMEGIHVYRGLGDQDRPS